MLLIMASILAGWLRDLDVMYFSAVNTSHWHWTTCLVKSLIHDACMIFVWAEELSRHTVVLCMLELLMLKRDILFVPGGDFSVRDIDAVIHSLCNDWC